MQQAEEGRSGQLLIHLAPVLGVTTGAKALELRGKEVLPSRWEGEAGVKNQHLLNASYGAEHVLRTVLNVLLILSFIILAS